MEINAHSLFSKWFSESGKLVQRLFSSINELIEEEDTFVVVLIGMHAYTSSVIPTLTTISRRGRIVNRCPSWRGCRHRTL
jgi:hypothetical protein